MRPKQLFIGFIIILLATTLLFPKTKEQKYCDQFSGESNFDQPTANYKSCETDAICKIKDTFTTKETNPNIIIYQCIPNDKLSVDQS